MKRVTKVMSLAIIFFIIVTSISTVFAVDIQTELKTVQESSEIKYLENDGGKFSKKLINLNEKKGEATVELTVSNTSKNTSQTKYENTEILAIFDENLVNDTANYEQYLNYLQMITAYVLPKNPNTKVGIIGMKGTIQSSVKKDESIVVGEDDEANVDGTEENAEIIAELTNDSTKLLSDFKKMNTDKKKYRSNYQAAIRLANKTFSKNVNKILISVYDSMPQISIGTRSHFEYGDNKVYKTAKESVEALYNKVVENTKGEILKLKDNDVDFIILEQENKEENETWYDDETKEKSFTINITEYREKIYGTEENPTYGSMYTMDISNMSKIVNEHLDLGTTEEKRADLKSVKIKEYFSDEILNNFDIEVENDSIDISKIKDDKYFIWNIGTIEADKDVSIKYTLKIKDMKNKDLLNKEIATNEKTELIYVDSAEKEITALLESSPKIKLVEITADNNINQKEDETNDTTVAPGNLPNTGIKNMIIFSIIATISLSIYSHHKNRLYKDIK